MAAGKKKPVRWTIPDVKAAPARPLEARTSAKPPGAAPYPSAAQFMAEGTYSHGWLEGALRAVLTPVAIASAVSLGASGCVDVGELLRGDEPASVYIDGASSPPATLTPIGAPGEGYGRFSGLPFGGGTAPSPPSKPPVTSSADVDIIPPCPLPPPGQPTSVTGTTPPAHPPTVRGRMPVVAPLPPLPPPPPPAPDPPALDGEMAVVRPEPPAMPGGLRVVHPTGDGGT